MTPKVGTTSWAQWSRTSSEATTYDGGPRNTAYIENLKLDPVLKPTEYRIEGTHPESKILFLDVNILDSTGRDPYQGDVLIEG